MPKKKGKYLSLEMLAVPVQGRIPSPIAAQDVPAEHHVLAGARTHHLPFWIHVTGTAAFSELPESTIQVLFSAGLVLCCSLQRAQRWHSSGGHGREQRGWGSFCSLCVVSHLEVT